MKLQSLRLKNFKGITGFTLDLQGKDITVKADNAVGKSSLADAFFWLLTDKDSHNKKDFEIKTLDENGQPLHGLDHEVEATIETGKKLILQKTYREKWTKQRGKAESTFSGHTVDHKINGVPVKAGEFKEAVDKIAPEEALRLLTDPKHFNVNMHWEERRKLLLEVCGDVSDREVIESDSRLSHLEVALEGREASEQKLVIQGRQKEIQKELDRIPTRIDEVNLNLPDISGVNRKAHEANIESLAAEIEGLEKQKRDSKGSSRAAELENELAILGAKMQNVKTRIREEHEKELRPLMEERRSLYNELNDMDDRIGKKKRAATSAAEHKGTLSLNNTLREEEIELIKAENNQFTFTQDSTCPTCGQGLPAKQLEEAREKALKAFNQKQSSRLEKLQTDIKSDKEEIKAKAAEIEKLKKEIKALEPLHKTAVERLQVVEAGLKQDAPDPEEHPDYIKLVKDKEKKQKELLNVSGNRPESDAIEDQIGDLKSQIQQSEKALLQLDSHSKGQARIKELKLQERDLAAEYERLEKDLFLIEEFTRVKVKLLEDKINSHFKHARFKLFEQHISGGISETCVCLYNGIPYNSGLNAGHQIIVGLDIIATLADYYNFYPPVFVDNSESITDLPEMKQQVIKLVKPEIKTDKDRAKYQKINVEVAK